MLGIMLGTMLGIIVHHVASPGSFQLNLFSLDSLA